MKTTQTPAEYYEQANAYVEKSYGTRAANYIEEGDKDRAVLKAELLNEYFSLHQDLARLLENYPAMYEHVEFTFGFR